MLKQTKPSEASRGSERNVAASGEPIVNPLVKFEHVTKRFGAEIAVDQVSLEIFCGEFFALLGPSGCGKTTLLRLLAGFEVPDEGRILLDGADLAGVPPHRRPTNMMFQNYALFPHLTVEQNVAFGLRQERMPKSQIEARVAEMLSLVRLEGFARRKPAQLSGGERQRVALARSLAKRPKVLLLDEPMAALDKKLRAQTQFELKELQAKLGTTFVIVTHDQDEAMIVADRMAVMQRGRIVQVGTPSEIYDRPNCRYVADFVGEVNLFEGSLAVTGTGETAIDCSAGRLRIPPQPNAASGTCVWLALRPEKLRIDRDSAPRREENALPGTVLEVGYRGSISVYAVRLENGTVMKVMRSNESGMPNAALQYDDRVWVSWPPEAAIVLSK
jgi:putrescine transport system ATP-binding protein